MTNNKNIVLCSDGTGQTDKGWGDTNVWRIYDSLDQNNEEIKQVVFYDYGVGNSKNIVKKFTGLVSGFGLSSNIRKLYKNLVLHYNLGDRIYMFGFSRGAHTIRILADIITNFGILNLKAFDDEEAIDKAIYSIHQHYKTAMRKGWLRVVFNSRSDENYTEDVPSYYNLSDKTDFLETKLSNKFNTKVDPIFYKNIRIRFLGLWDTVSAIGLTINEFRSNLFTAPNIFYENKLHPSIDRACHALSIDETRHSFKPELWDESEEEDNRIEQVWFAGSHANVGGGYPKDQLSLVSLEWMIKESEMCGLKFTNYKIFRYKSNQNPSGAIYNSRSGIAKLHRYNPRNILKIVNEANRANENILPKIHISVFQRILDPTAYYSPLNIPKNSQVVITSAMPKAEIYNEFIDKKNKVKAKIFNYEIKSNFEANPWSIVFLQKTIHIFHLLFFYFFITTGILLTNQTPEIAITHTVPFLNSLQTIAKLLNESNIFYISKILPGYANHWEIFSLMIFVFISITFINKLLIKKKKNIGSEFWNVPPFNQNRIPSKIKKNVILDFVLKIIDYLQRNYFAKLFVNSLYIKIFPIITTNLILFLLISIVMFFSITN